MASKANKVFTGAEQFAVLKFALATSLVFFLANEANAENLLKGKVLKENDAKPNATLVDKYGEAANDPAVATALRSAQSKNLSSRQIKAKAKTDELLQKGIWQPGADPKMALMYGYVPPGMSPEEAAFMAKHLPKLPRIPQRMSPEEMAGEPNPDLQMPGAPEPVSPFIPIPNSIATRQQRTMQLPLIHNGCMSPEQLFDGQIAPQMMGAPVMPYGANKRAVAEINKRLIEDSLRGRFGPGYEMPHQGRHNLPAQTKPSQSKQVVSNHQSVVGLIDNDGNEVTSIQYDPYGQPTVLQGTEMPAFMYQGMYYHSRSGKYLTLFRAYDPKLGRWLSRDPVGESVGANLYAYVENNPIGFRDPLGLEPEVVQYWQAVRGNNGHGEPVGAFHGNTVVRDGEQILQVFGGHVVGGDPTFHGAGTLSLKVAGPMSQAQYDKYYFPPVACQRVKSKYPTQTLINNLNDRARSLSQYAVPYQFLGLHTGIGDLQVGGYNSNSMDNTLLRQAGGQLEGGQPSVLAPGFGEQIPRNLYPQNVPF